MIPGRETDNPVCANRGSDGPSGGSRGTSIVFNGPAARCGGDRVCCSAASMRRSASDCRVSFGLLDVPHVAHPAFLVHGVLRGVLPQRALRYRPAAGWAADHAAALRVRSCRLPPVLRDIRKARQRCRRARHRILLRRRLHHRSADHPAIRRRPALGHRDPISARPGGSATCGFRSGWWSHSRSPPR